MAPAPGILRVSGTCGYRSVDSLGEGIRAVDDNQPRAVGSSPYSMRLSIGACTATLFSWRPPSAPADASPPGEILVDLDASDLCHETGENRLFATAPIGSIKFF
jgi:hypothetical protein